MRKIKAQRRDQPVIGLEFTSWFLASFWNSSVGLWKECSGSQPLMAMPGSHQVVQCLPGLVSNHLSPTNGGRYSRSYGQGTGTYHVSTLAVRSWSKGPWVPLPGDYSSSIPSPCHSWIPTLASFLTPGLLYYLVVPRTDHITTLFRHLPWLPDTCE